MCPRLRGLSSLLVALGLVSCASFGRIAPPGGAAQPSDGRPSSRGAQVSADAKGSETPFSAPDETGEARAPEAVPPARTRDEGSREVPARATTREASASGSETPHEVRFRAALLPILQTRCRPC